MIDKQTQLFYCSQSFHSFLTKLSTVRYNSFLLHILGYDKKYRGNKQMT